MKNPIASLLRSLLDTLRAEPNLRTLQRNGLTVGKNFQMMSQCRIDFSHCWHITIGDDVILAPRVHILAHDASTRRHLGYTKVADVRIGNNVFVGAGSIVLPGVVIGDDCIIGAGSVVSRDVPAGHVAAGSPARVIMTTADYLRKQRAKMTADNCFDESYTIHAGVRLDQKAQLCQAIRENGIAFVK